MKNSSPLQTCVAERVYDAPVRRATLLSLSIPLAALTAAVIIALLPAQHAPTVPTADGEQRTPTGVTFSFADGVDAVSFAMPQDLRGAAVRAWIGDRWSPWEELAVETEFDPLLTESNLVLFPAAAHVIELRSSERLEPHPIRVSQEPAAYTVAARTPMQRPRILTRNEWGADESYLVRGPEPTRSDAIDPDTQVTESREVNTVGDQPAARVTDCLQMQRDYPEEFRVAKTVRETPDGKTLRWAQQYSKQVRIIAVHHTAITVAGDARSGVERIRALYAYHANNRGWGDVGYHYLIDNDGQIYEGRAGGPGVVGGHAYCNNVGSMGVALLGNFELEQPSQSQMAALQWLLHDLAATYAIDLQNPVLFHGKMLTPIVGHGNLVSTTCPGYYLRETLDQVRRNVRTNNLTARIAFPSLPKAFNSKTKQRASSRTAKARSFASVAPESEGVAAMGGDSTISGRPNAQVLISLRYQAGGKAHRAGEQVARVERSDEGIRLWQEDDGAFVPVLRFLKLPNPVSSRNAVQLRLKLQLPERPGRYTLQFDAVTYVIDVQGRALRASASATSDPRQRPLRPPSSSSSSSVRSVGRSAPASRMPKAADGPSIRILLSYSSPTATLDVPTGTTVNGAAVRQGGVELQQVGNFCVARQQGKELARGTLRFDAHATKEDGIITIGSWQKDLNRFRGIIECQVIDGAMVFINELPMEQYLRGLSEEPDSEPLEKQRAFAIAARTYAAFYADPAHRKFPGKPYDGSDDPRVFQAYGGAGFEGRNEAWVRAVDSTHLLVLTKDGDILKTPYFSVSDGRTLSPSEAGWNTYPHAEVFQSKPDPWCTGMTRRGHGVGMSGCGALAQAKEGKSAEEILSYYYKGAVLTPLR